MVGSPAISFAQAGGSTASSGASKFDDLATLLRGELITPEHDDYDKSRQVWNAMIDKHPAAIARFDSLRQVRETAEIARPMFLMMLLVCLYAFATIASFFPPFTPFLMMARVAAVPGPPTWQIWASLLLLVLATYLAIRLAARVFRVGILMYGKPPRLSEIWRWMFTDR